MQFEKSQKCPICKRLCRYGWLIKRKDREIFICDYCSKEFIATQYRAHEALDKCDACKEKVKDPIIFTSRHKIHRLCVPCVFALFQTHQDYHREAEKRQIEFDKSGGLKD